MPVVVASARLWHRLLPWLCRGGRGHRSSLPFLVGGWRRLWCLADLHPAADDLWCGARIVQPARDVVRVAVVAVDEEDFRSLRVVQR